MEGKGGGEGVHGRYNENPRYAACICGGWVLRMALAFHNVRTSAWRCIFDKLKIKTTTSNNCQSDHKPRVIAFSNWLLGIIHKEIQKKFMFSRVSGNQIKNCLLHLYMNVSSKILLQVYLLACENIRFSSLFVAGDVSRGGTSATQEQKFHTDDANQCLHNKSGSHGVPNLNVSNFAYLLVDFGKVLCSSAHELQ